MEGVDHASGRLWMFLSIQELDLTCSRRFGGRRWLKRCLPLIDEKKLIGIAFAFGSPSSHPPATEEWSGNPGKGSRRDVSKC